MTYDYCVLGGGIVGLATARALLERQPDARIVLLEKEPSLAVHQTGHNSGVIHAGIYYTPGSLKAKLCREGLHATIEFCQEHAIPFDQCGKLIVATNAEEHQRIDDLFERATANGLKLERLSAGQLSETEPAISGVGALFSPETAIVDYRQISEKMAAILKSQGVEIILNTEVDYIKEQSAGVSIGSRGQSWQARKLIVCGGLQSDRLARMAGLEVDFRIVPFRGEYFQLPSSKNAIIRSLIYPAPDPDLPFLGVHLTRMIDGSVTVGPNAVIGLAREGYRKSAIDLRDMASFLSYPAFWKLIWSHKRHTLHELKGSLWRSAYLAECRKYCPELSLSDLLPYRAGIRAQVVMSNGTAMHDFLFRQTDHMLHVCNAPSPAATSALPIGRMIADRLIGPHV